MLSHVFTSVTDFERAYAFYSALMQVLGHGERFVDRDKPWAGWHSADASRPFFVICKPYNGQPHQAGNGQMVAFDASHRAQVEQAYRSALALGGVCEGPPGLRAHYHAHYFAAYFRDPDGNKLCVVCHQPDPGPAAHGTNS